MTRRNLIWISLAVTLPLLAWLAVLDGRMTDTGGPGIVPFEVAGTEDRAAEILDEWGEEGRDAAEKSLWWDYPYLVSYGLLLWLLVQAARERAAAWRRRGLASRFGPWIGAMPIAAAVFDAIEDVFLLLALGRHGGELAPALGAGFAALKFAALALTVIFLLVYLAGAFQNRGAAAGGNEPV